MSLLITYELSSSLDTRLKKHMKCWGGDSVADFVLYWKKKEVFRRSMQHSNYRYTKNIVIINVERIDMYEQASLEAAGV